MTGVQTVPRVCFVIMPFSPTRGVSAADWRGFFEDELVPIVEGEGYQCLRSSPDRGSILKDIIARLNNAYLVVADLTGLKPNVIYELGVRHSLSKRTIMITRDDPKKLPFDLASYGAHQYSIAGTANLNAFRSTLSGLLKNVDREPEKDDSPVADFASLRAQTDLDRDNQAMLRVLAALAREMESIKREASGARPTAQNGLLATAPALEYFMATFPIDNRALRFKVEALYRYLVYIRRPLGFTSEDYAQYFAIIAAFAEAIQSDAGILHEAILKQFPVRNVRLPNWTTIALEIIEDLRAKQKWTVGVGAGNGISFL